MPGVKILLVEENEKCLLPLERKLLDGFEKEGDLQVITDPEYLTRYFSVPRTLDILVIQEELYQPGMEKHNIGNIFFLTEQDENEDTGSLLGRRIYKYTSAESIYKQVVNNLSGTTAAHIKKSGETTFLYVYSPIGGVGKTTVAAGISAILARSHQRTLYIGMDSLQSFGWLMDPEQTLPGEVEKRLLTQSNFVYNLIKPYLVEQQFYLLPPFSRMLSSLHIPEQSFVGLMESVITSHDFDYVVVDGASGFSETTSRLMQMAQHVVLVAAQDRVSVHKMDCLVKNIDCSDKGHFTFVCNRFEEGNANFLEEPGKRGYTVSEYIPREEKLDLTKPEEIGQIRSIQKLAFAFL